MAKSFKVGSVECKLVNKPMRDGKVRLIEFVWTWRGSDDSFRQGLAWDGCNWFEIDFYHTRSGKSKRWTVQNYVLGWQYAHWFDWSLRGWLWQRLGCDNATPNEVNELAMMLEKLVGLPVTDQEQYTKITPSGGGDRIEPWWRPKPAPVFVSIYETRPGCSGKRFDVIAREFPDLDSALVNIDRLTCNAEQVSFGFTDEGSKGKAWVYLSAYPYNGDIRYSDGSRRSNEDAVALLDLIRGEPCPYGSIAVRRDNRAARREAMKVSA